MPGPSTDLQNAQKIKKLSVAVLDPRPLAIYVAASGNIDINNSDGTSEAGVLVVAGATIPLQVYEITAIAAGTVVYGLY